MAGVLKGKKTYVAAGLGVIGAAAAYLTGEANTMQAGQMILTAIVSATLRGAIPR